MKKIWRLSFVLCISAVLLGCQTLPQKQVSVIQTQSGFATEVWKYKATDRKKPTAILYMHGKSASLASHHNARFIAEMSVLGYDVYAPIMPWSSEKYEGTLDDSHQIIHRTIETMPADRIVVAGHSMGGIVVLQYGSGDVDPKVIGLISIAPGHDPNISEPLRTHTRSSAVEACHTMNKGQGKARASYKEMKSGKTYDINASAEYYCTHYNEKHFPSSLAVAEEIGSPLYLLSGRDDKLTRHYRHGEVFDQLPSSPANRHRILSGGHGDVLYRHNDEMADWIDAL